MNDFKRMFSEYRSSLKIKRKHKINDKQRILIGLVNEFKNNSDIKKTSDFWIKVLDEWNKRMPDKKYKNWESIYKIYNRAVNKLNLRFMNKK